LQRNRRSSWVEDVARVARPVLEACRVVLAVALVPIDVTSANAARITRIRRISALPAL
jgi:hypothetical protein